ncbi:Imm27 family immunity protein [Asticcacaulis sp. W401b]|uniref:Imm27 family immunity protein n=1 Tax=Asticcacaulis sp. W401b TaxID=3388666 RepID=UPI003970C5F2
MRKLATSEDGWSELHYDDVTGRYFEKTYPESDQHGGGQPRFDEVSETFARQKYQF